jgi:hypothetical protein
MAGAAAQQSNFVGGTPSQLDAKSDSNAAVEVPGRQPLELA